MYTPGDLIIQETPEGNRYAEVVGVDQHGKVEVSFIRKTAKQEGRIWEFDESNDWESIASSSITKHVKVPDEADRKTMVKAWAELGDRKSVV